MSTLIGDWLRGRGVDLVILGLVAAGVGAGAWMTRSAFVPLLEAAGPDYVFLAAPFSTFVAWSLGAFAALVAVHVRTGVRSNAPARLRDVLERVSYVAPLLLLPLLLLPLLVLRGSPPRSVVVLSYFLVDLRGWYVMGATALFALGLAKRAHWRPGSIPWRPPAWMASASLAAAAVAFGLVSSPPHRFESRIVGNEPKYLRYLETFYQGRGFRIDDNALFDDFVPGSADRVGQLSSLVGGAARAARDLSHEAVGWMRGAQGPSNKASYRGSSFVIGKDGGTYQLHTPGLPFVLYPLYYIDRQYLENEAGYLKQLPKRLTCTNAGVLGLYTLLGLAIFRLLARYTGNRLLSWFLALTTLITLPVAPFNFQYYPEVAAGLAIVLLCHAVLFESGREGRHGLLYGVLAGWLPWLHVRFLAVSLVCAGGFMLASRQATRRVVTFAVGYGGCLALLGLYVYHITGSPLPNAMFEVMPQRHFGLANIPFGIAGFLLDRDFGILPFSPIYFLAFLGLRPLLVERRREAGFICLVAGALVLLAAAFREWQSGSSTPSRMIVAVTPFAALALAHAFQRFGGGRVFKVVAALLWVVSVDVAYAYNSHLQRPSLVFADDSFSGWKPTLLFPSIVRIGREPDAPIRTAFWLGIVAAVALGAWFRAKRPRANPTRFTSWRFSAALAAMVAVASVAGGALTRGPGGFRPQLMIDGQHASEEALDHFLRDGCAPCVSSREGILNEHDIVRRFPQPGVRTRSHAAPGTPGVGTAHQHLLQLRLPPDRNSAGATLVWEVPASAPNRALIELHARTERSDPSVVLSATVFDRREAVIAAREIRTDELVSAGYVVVPLYLAVDPGQ